MSKKISKAVSGVFALVLSGCISSAPQNPGKTEISTEELQRLYRIQYIEYFRELNRFEPTARRIAKLACSYSQDGRFSEEEQRLIFEEAMKAYEATEQYSKEKGSNLFWSENLRDDTRTKPQVVFDLYRLCLGIEKNLRTGDREHPSIEEHLRRLGKVPEKLRIE